MPFNSKHSHIGLGPPAPSRRQFTLGLLGMLAAPLALADGPLRIKLGTLLPKGSAYHRALQDLSLIHI